MTAPRAGGDMQKRILIVDDEPDITEMVKLGLEATGGYRVLEENDSAKALEAARSFGPDVILLDVMMPEPDGSELAALFRQDNALKDIPILFLTALVSKAESHDPQFGFDRRHYLPKPVDFEDLVKHIEEISLASCSSDLAE
jgi:CheY-like chemotaxis protein